jgi:hypothetical protein
MSSDCSTPDASVLHARLLSPSQYDNTIQDLLNVGGDPAGTYHVSGGDGTALDQTALAFRAQAAAAIAAQAAANLSPWSPCVPANAAAQAACEQQIISTVGQRAYRRSLTTDESTQMKALFDGGIAAKDFATGVDWFLTGLLQTPQFQYQLIRPSASEQPGQIVPITGYEMASRLSYYLWDSMPDETLFSVAGSGGLNDKTGVQTQVTRMMQNAASLQQGMTAFYSQWFNVPGYSEGIVKDDATGQLDPAFTQDVAVSLGQSILMGATSLYTMPSPNLSTLFSGDTYLMNATLQQYYKVGTGGTATTFVPTSMANQGRSGILTHPGFLAVNARAQVTAPILRGVFVIWNLLCLTLQVPTNITIPPLPETPQPGLTTRELIAQSHVQAQCAYCHNVIDPPGFALEGFDQIGNVRTTDNGQPVDTSATIVGGGDLDGVYASADAFLAKVPQSVTVKSCFAKQFTEHTLSGVAAHPVAADDVCSVGTVSQQFAQTGDLLGLVGLVAASDSFLYRKSEGAAQ